MDYYRDAQASKRQECCARGGLRTEAKQLCADLYEKQDHEGKVDIVKSVIHGRNEVELARIRDPAPADEPSDLPGNVRNVSRAGSQR